VRPRDVVDLPERPPVPHLCSNRGGIRKTRKGNRGAVRRRVSGKARTQEKLGDAHLGRRARASPPPASGSPPPPSPLVRRRGATCRTEAQDIRRRRQDPRTAAYVEGTAGGDSGGGRRAYHGERRRVDRLLSLSDPGLQRTRQRGHSRSRGGGGGGMATSPIQSPFSQHSLRRRVI
jgi:hypothetical protein